MTCWDMHNSRKLRQRRSKNKERSYRHTTNAKYNIQFAMYCVETVSSKFLRMVSQNTAYSRHTYDASRIISSFQNNVLETI